jgi:hypothetical protein
MPGTFAHITLVDSLCEATLLDRLEELQDDVKHALLSNLKFCELGAVSPDYPYLVLRDDEAAGWANVMHYWWTADFIRSGLHHLLDDGFGTLDSSDAQKCIAWLFGYTSHVVADMTIHPVIELIVGPYAAHKTAHRVCEMHQDAYIFRQWVEEEIDSAEYLKHAGLRDCGEKLGDTHHLAPPLAKLWTLILNDVHRTEVTFPPDLPKPNESPRPDDWHHHYVTTIDDFAEEGNRFFLARGAMESLGLVYPPSKKVQLKFIKNLKTPDHATADYDAVFESARQNVISIWRQLGHAITARNPTYLILANGNLDTGMADGAAPGTPHIFWSA